MPPLLPRSHTPPTPQAIRPFALAFGLGLATGLGCNQADAQVFSFSVGRSVPDGSGVGLPDVRTVAGAPSGSAPVVGLTLGGVGAGMINGDLYASLAHLDANGVVDAFVVLLNRPGKRADDDEGYFDSGIDVSFSTDPSAPDVHDYRLSLTGDHDLPLDGPLGGTWSPDGRITDPDLVLDTDPRTTSLDAFAGIDPNAGQWVLFVADVAGGGEAQLDGWSLTFVPVPEPAEIALVLGLGLGGWAIALRTRGRIGSSIGGGPRED